MRFEKFYHEESAPLTSLGRPPFRWEQCAAIFRAHKRAAEATVRVPHLDKNGQKIGMIRRKCIVVEFEKVGGFPFDIAPVLRRLEKEGRQTKEQRAQSDVQLPQVSTECQKQHPGRQATKRLREDCVAYVMQEDKTHARAVRGIVKPANGTVKVCPMSMRLRCRRSHSDSLCGSPCCRFQEIDELAFAKYEEFAEKQEQKKERDGITTDGHVLSLEENLVKLQERDDKRVQKGIPGLFSLCSAL